MAWTSHRQRLSERLRDDRLERISFQAMLTLVPLWAVTLGLGWAMGGLLEERIVWWGLVGTSGVLVGVSVVSGVMVVGRRKGVWVWLVAEGVAVGVFVAGRLMR